MLILTGGAGFIGSVVLRRLNELGRDDIIVVDELGNSDKWRNLQKASFADFIHKDIFYEKVKKESVPWSIDAIVHLGACSSTTNTNADYLMDNNFHYSRDVCRFALEKGARFINASSAATYGAGEYGFADTLSNIAKLRPLNMYGYSKQLMDLWLLKNRLDDEVASLKFFNVYGPNEYHKGNMQSVVLKIFREINNGKEASLFESNSPDIKNGEQKRDFVYVKDCATLITWLLTDGKAVNGIKNVGTGKAATFNKLAAAVFAALEKPVKIRYIPMPNELAKNYQNFTEADMSWLQKENYPLNFRDITEGISDYVSNYLAKNDIYL